MRTIRVGSRKSLLAIRQTNLVLDQLRQLHPDRIFEVVPYTTKGDQLQDVPLSVIGGKGIFVTDIETAIQQGKIDMAVHSMKDLPAILAPGCTIGAVSPREDVRDCLVFSNPNWSLANLPSGSIVGTSSLRRTLQLQRQRPDLVYRSIRGNIDSRIEKVKEGQYQAVVLAMAGLKRLGWQGGRDIFLEPLSLDICLPAVAQAALAIECRQEDTEILDLLATFNDKQVAQCVAIERQFLSLLQADCTFPISALAQTKGDGYVLQTMLAFPKGECHYAQVEGKQVNTLASEAFTKLKEAGLRGLPNVENSNYP